MRFQIVNEWANSYYSFENGDGTRYMVHLTACEHGGIYIIEGNTSGNSLWIWFEGETVDDHELKHLAGPQNKWTEKAMAQIMVKHWAERMP